MQQELNDKKPILQVMKEETKKLAEEIKIEV